MLKFMEQILGNSDISDYIGNKNTSGGIVDIVTAELINSTIGKKPNEEFKNGDPLPPLWHWFAFPSATHLSQLGDDGHPKHVGRRHYSEWGDQPAPFTIWRLDPNPR